jgi:iron-sulfur cluster repair protein YtfE (RIC family)
MANKTDGSNGFSAQSATVAAAIGGLAIGLMANMGRKAVVQGMTASAGEWDQALAAEHDATLLIFDKLQATTENNTAKRKFLLMQLKHALSKHAHQEENVVYPAMRANGLTDEADELNKEHGYVKQFLFELTEMEPSDRRWAAKVSEFRTEIEAHMREEEETLFPALRDKLGDEGNHHITVAMNKEGFKVA